ncbi:MAG: hypothetical protein ACRDH2_06595, partial [Anaerolineales bacterium]
MRTPLRTTLLILLVTSLLAGARSARSSQAGQSFSQSENVPLAAPDPLACSGYAEPRLFLDTQAGWITTPGKAGANHGQIQIATCFPLNQTVTGVVPLDLRLTMHDNPGQLVSLAVQVFTDSGETVIAKQSFSPALTCQGTCEFWVHVDADTTQVPYDGRQEWRIRARVNEPDGKALSSSTNWQTYLANGKPLNHYRNYDLLKGKSTHNDSSVAARLDSGYPLAPVTEPFTVRFRCEADGPAISECLVAVDSDFDKGNPGVILYQTTSSSEEPRALTIDPAQFPAGAHRLVVRASANHSIGSTNVGMLGLPFTVVGGAGPTNTPTATQTAAATQTQTQAATDTPVLDATGTPAPTFTQTSAPAQTDTPTSTQI